MPSNLEHIYHLVTDEILTHKAKYTTDNLTKSQRVSLRNLSNQENFIFKKADKGSNIVIMNKTDYIAEAHSQLNNTSFYKRTPKPLTESHRKMVQDVVERMFEDKQISEKTFKFLMEGGTRTAIFYTLPKIHKNLTSPPGRPIISSNNCPTEKISQLIDIVLQPYIVGESYIKDTTDFLVKVQDLTLDQNDWLLALDVTGLYTNIPHSEGIDCIDQLLRNIPHIKPSKHYILELLNLVLKCNNFRFGEEEFLQINGTAMGTRVAPTYAVIFMNHFEQQHIYSYQGPGQIRKWFRFIDDIWSIFRGSSVDVQKFMEHINNVHSSIKFTGDFSKDEVIFLDVRTKIEGSKIKTITYSKPTDSHSYLDFDSCHPSHNKTSIPYSQFLRMRRNCSEWTDFICHSLRLMTHLNLRGYPYEILHNSIVRVNQKTRSEVLSANLLEQNPTNSLYCILDYNPSNPNVRGILNKYWPITDRSSSTRILSNTPIIIGYRRPKNLQEILCRTDIVKLDYLSQNKLPLCSNPFKCRHCPRLNKTGSIQSSSTGRKYKCMKKVSCNSKNLIYCITCILCKKQYVGQTKNQIRIHMNQHLSTIRTKSDTPVSRHFNSHEYKFKEDPPLKVTILQLIRGDNNDNASLRDKWEEIWISRLYSLVPNGLNIKD